MTTNAGTELLCADTHILITVDQKQVFAKDSMGAELATATGSQRVVLVENLGYLESMYDLTVGSQDHTYYTNGLLSHNTTVAAGYLLWYAMFNEDATVLIAAHKYDGAQEIMHRVRYAYESVPDHIRAGVKEYNKRSMLFDNGSRIVASTTSETTGRGMSLSLIYCLGGENTVTVRGLKEPRYLLKALDLELPIKNEHYPKSPNKNEFHDADMQDLTHHISWLRELLWDNKIVPFNDINLTKGL